MKKKRTTKIIVHKQYPIIKLKVHDLEEDYDRISRVLCVTMFFWGGDLEYVRLPPAQDRRQPHGRTKKCGQPRRFTTENTKKNCQPPD